MVELDRMVPVSVREINFVEAGAIAERERIIKLLEKLICEECEMNGFENNLPNFAIALIKGEAE